MGITTKSAINWAQVVPMHSVIQGLAEDRSPVYLDLDATRSRCSTEGFSASLGTKSAVNKGIRKR